ncbi:MAG: hypothetical protein HYT79_07130 [Elusimicrobia bacterium]|nr:hypothetical protein [Elusimicrobiota bacterium]
MITPFSAMFVKLRKDAGFESPYDFYHKNGGAKVLQLSFVGYLKIEKGEILPQAKRLSLLIHLLRIKPGTEQVRGLLAAYIKTMVGDHEVFDSLFQPMMEGRRLEGSLSALSIKAAKVLSKERVQHLTPDQFHGVIQDPAGYWCLEVLTNDEGPWTIETLAKLLKMSKSEINAAMNNLKKHKLAKEKKKGEWISAFGCRHFTAPASLTYGEAERECLKKCWETARKNGINLMNRAIAIRASEADIRNYLEHIREALDTAAVYASFDRTPDSQMFLIHTQAHKLFPL